MNTPHVGAPDAIDSNAVAKLAGITYRQLDYWLRRGFVYVSDPEPGSGYQRQFSLTESAQVIALSALVRIGFSPESASHVLKGPAV